MRYLFLTLVFSTASAAMTLSLVPSAQSEERPALAQSHSAQHVSAPRVELPTTANFAPANKHHDCTGLTVLLAALESKSCS